MFSDILRNFLTQLVYFFGIIFLIGFLISLINRTFFRLVNYNRGVCLATGLLGTPIHELSHALMCVVFRHKVHEIKLFQADAQNGVLGYVRHSYNPKNWWQNIGNYFIGIAPILCGSAVILLAGYYLLPNGFDGMIDSLTVFSSIQKDVFSTDWLTAYWDVFCGMIVAMGSESFTEWQTWVFLIVSLCVALHMNLSGAAIKGALPAIPLLLVLLFGVNCLFGFILSDFYGDYLHAVNFAGGFLSGVLLLAVILSLVYLLLGSAVALLRRILLKR